MNKKVFLSITGLDPASKEWQKVDCSLCLRGHQGEITVYEARIYNACALEFTFRPDNSAQRRLVDIADILYLTYLP